MRIVPYKNDILVEQLDESLPYTICPECGFRNFVSDYQCKKCGHKYKLEEYRVVFPEEEYEKINYEKINNKYKRTCPRCKSDNVHAFVEEVQISEGKTKTRYAINLNPLRPFTLVNKKEKVIKKPRYKNVSRFLCDDCGKIFS